MSNGVLKRKVRRSVSVGGSKVAEEVDSAPPAWWTNGSSFEREQNSPEAESKILLARTHGWYLGVVSLLCTVCAKEDA